MKTTVSSEVLDVIVVGAGQAGLAVAYHLSRQGAHFQVLDAGGERGISAARGLAFIGLPWQHTRGSALLGFVHHDAAWVAAQLRAQLAAHHPQRPVGVSVASTGD